MATADEDRIELRRAEALRLRCRGYSVREIGAELGISKSVAADDVRKAMGEAKKLSQEELDTERELELHRIDLALKVVAKILNDREVTAAEAAKLDISMAELLDSEDELKLKAIDRQVKLQEQRAKLLGLYAPEKRDINATVSAVSLEELDVLRATAKANECPPPTGQSNENEPSS